MIRIFYIAIIFVTLLLNVSQVYAEKFIYDSKGKRSPFSPPGSGPEGNDTSNVDLNLTVNGIIWDDNEPYAIIDDKIVKKGDTITGALVFEIQKNEVILKIKDKMFVLKIKERKAIT